MSLPAGFRLGPYEVLTFLGRGGMGEVYTGRDERLGRIVALKLLPPELAQDTRRLRRLEREARAASALNHPNIVTIHEFATSDGHSYIVMEYVEGKTLRDHMRGGPLPVRQIVDLASQVTNGLAAAHVRGIVHRDLKPENIMLAQSGFAKILDFGLAKDVASGEGSGEPSSQTSTTQTGPHVIVGTLSYMSPEQGKGRRCRLPFRPIFTGCRPLRDVHRTAPVPPGGKRRDDQGDSP
jgi:serine/threonine protein kinase